MLILFLFIFSDWIDIFFSTEILQSTIQKRILKRVLRKRAGNSSTEMFSDHQITVGYLLLSLDLAFNYFAWWPSPSSLLCLVCCPQPQEELCWRHLSLCMSLWVLLLVILLEGFTKHSRERYLFFVSFRNRIIFFKLGLLPTFSAPSSIQWRFSF